MNIQPMLWSLCTVIVLSGCSSSKSVEKNSQVNATAEVSTSLNKAHMDRYIASAESQLVLLEQQMPKACISGQLAIAQSYITRASAEHNAGMEKDAFITLVTFDRQIRKIHCINQYIKGQLGCDLTNKKVIMKRWYDEGDFDQCENSAQSTTMIAKSAKNTKQKHKVITETLYDFNQAEIKPIYYQSLNKFVDLIKHYPKSTLVISGHTDTIGSTPYNLQLSERRAQSIRKYFTNKGIATSQISIRSNGEKNIREVEQSDVARVFNRYTSITLNLDTSDDINL